MKKILTFAVAVLAVMTAFGQTNLALNMPSIATSGVPERGNDGSTGSRWESDSSDPQQWQVDLGEAQAFNTIVINWENAYGKTFDIVGGNTVDDEGWITDGVVLASVEGQELNDFPHKQSLILPAAVNYRYVQFMGKERGTQWGYSFWEFEVYNADVPVLTTMTLAISGPQVTVGNTIGLTLNGFDQMGVSIATGNVTYVLSNPEVGTVENGLFKAVAVGETTIKAVSGDVESNEVTVKVIPGQKIDLFTGWDYRIYNLGLATSVSKDGAFDQSLTSLWDMYKETGSDEESRTYDVGFIADLRGVYDLSSTSVYFEGACSENFTLSFAGEDGVFGDAAFTGGAMGVNKHTEYFDCNEIKNVRYVKFLSTKAATQWSVKIYDFSVFGTLVSTVTDTVAPVIVSAEADAEAATETSVTLNLCTTDNSSKYVAYKIDGKMYAQGTSENGSVAPIVIGGLNGGALYNFDVIAIDAFNNQSEAVSVTAQTAGDLFVLTAAPVPTHAAADVVSIYSNAYEPATSHWIGGWGQSTIPTHETVDGDEMYVFTNFNYLGFEYNPIDLSEMEYLHIDVLPMQDMRLGVTPILQPGGGAPNTEQPTSVGDLTPRQWNSIDMPLSTFNTLDFTSALSHQFKFDVNGGSTADKLYIDNLYFWKAASGVRGDLNGDGTVDVADINIIINMMLGKTEKTSIADLNNDNTIDVADINVIINIMLGK